MFFLRKYFDIFEKVKEKKNGFVQLSKFRPQLLRITSSSAL